MSTARWTRLAAVASLLACAGLASAQVKWRSLPESPVVNAGATVADAIDAISLAGADRHAVAQLSRPITEQGRLDLAARGVVVDSFLGNNAFFVTLRGGVDAAGVERSGWIKAIEPVRTQAKLHPVFGAKNPMALFVHNPSLKASATDDPSVPVYVMFHADALNSQEQRKLILGHAGAIKGELMSINAMVVELPLSRVAPLAAEDLVQWVEPALPLMEPNNDQARALTQADQLQAAPYGLSGSGVKVLVYDGGIVRMTHVDLAGRVTNVDGNGAGVSSHSTHVAGSVGGSGAGNALYKGMAPGVTFYTAGLNISGVTEWLYTNLADMEVEYTTACAGNNAVIATNSIGTNVGTNGFPCDWYGNYGAVSAWIDSVVRGDSAVTNFQPLRVTWAAGNERQSATCLGGGGGYASLAPPASAKNQMGIGAINSNNDSMTSFSSWGPSEDGRMKPDFCAPGCQSGGDNGITSSTSTSDTSYGAMCGTSMATPVTAGCTALVLQDYRAQFPGNPDPRNSFFRALFAQTTVDLGNAGPDYQSGYGSIRARNAVDLMRTGQFVNGSSTQSGRITYAVNIPPGAPSLSFTIAWDDFPGTGNIITGLVNDLDLVVRDPSGARRYPWTLNPASPAAPAVQTAENHIDNLEQVRVTNPAAGTWTIQVRGTTVPQGPQPFSLVGSHAMTQVPNPPAVDIVPVTLAPSLIAPGMATPVSINVFVDSDTLVPGSVGVVSRTGSGSWTTTPLTNTGGNTWAGSLPAFLCGDTPQYYFTAQGAGAGTVTLPAGGAGSPYTASVGTIQTFVSDAFETDTGWTTPLAGDTATTGMWERADPQGTFNGSAPSQPEDDHTPAPGTLCLVTQAAAGTGVGSFDIDNGFTSVRSPAYDLVGQANANISFWAWFYTSGAGDYLRCDVSGDGANWTQMFLITTAANSWTQYSFRLGDFLPNPTATTYFRFQAADTGTATLSEAAVDDFLIQTQACTNPPSCIADFNHSGGTPDDADVSAFFAAWNAGDPSADVNASGGTPDDADVSFFFFHWNAGC